MTIPQTIATHVQRWSVSTRDLADTTSRIGCSSKKWRVFAATIFHKIPRAWHEEGCPRLFLHGRSLLDGKAERWQLGRGWAPLFDIQDGTLESGCLEEKKSVRWCWKELRLLLENHQWTGITHSLFHMSSRVCMRLNLMQCLQLW